MWSKLSQQFCIYNIILLNRYKLVSYATASSKELHIDPVSLLKRTSYKDSNFMWTNMHSENRFLPLPQSSKATSFNPE